MRFDRAHFSGFGPSSLDVEIVYIVNSADYLVHMDTRQSIFLAVYREFNARGIDFAYPTQTVHVVAAHENGAHAAAPGREGNDRARA